MRFRLHSFLTVAGILATVACPSNGNATKPNVAEHYGNIEYTGVDGITRTLTQGGHYGEPVLSPDGRTVAFIHIDALPTEEGEAGFDSLWIADGPTNKARRLLGPKPSDDPRKSVAAFSHPVFSLDGHFIYILAEGWATSSAVHQVSVGTGNERFVIDANSLQVLRTGPMRGYLLVGRHGYFDPPKVGSFDAMYVVRPDAKEIIMIPGSEDDQNPNTVSRWLKEKAAVAW